MIYSVLQKFLVQSVPASVLCIFFVLLLVAISQAGLLLFNLWYERLNLPQNTEMAGLIFGAQSLIYSLILAFVIVAVWSDYEELNQTIEKEADKLNSILSHSLTLPGNLKHPVKDALASYCNQIVNDEWKMQESDRSVQPSAIPKLRLMLLQFEPRNKLEESIFSVIDDDLSSISDLRRNRLSHTRSHVPDLVWVILKAGSIMMIIFSYFLSASSDMLKRIYLFFLVSIVALSLFLVYTLDHPFDGSTQVSKKAYENILLELKQY